MVVSVLEEFRRKTGIKKACNEELKENRYKPAIGMNQLKF
jgi:hypothetical protein